MPCFDRSFLCFTLCFIVLSGCDPELAEFAADPGQDVEDIEDDGGLSGPVPDVSGDLLAPPVHPTAAPCGKSMHTYTLEAALGPQSFAIDESGALWAWGANESGQLGLGTTTSASPTPARVKFGLPSVIEVRGGTAHTLARTTDGRVWAWGQNASGQLGLGHNTGSAVPVLVPGLTGVLQIAAGGDFSLARTSNGQIWAWGSNLKGQLGINSGVPWMNIPQPITTLVGAELGAGKSFAVGVKGGQMWTWGSDESGQLGNGAPTDNVLKPMWIVVPGGVSGFAVGADFVVTVGGSSSWRSWGSNAYGQLADNTMNARTSPTSIAGPTLFGVSLMEASASSVFVAGPDGFGPPLPGLGLLLSAGRNDRGQLLRTGPTTSLEHLGDGYGTFYADTLAAGDGFTLVQANGVQAIGSNNRGQLGDGTTSNSTTLRQVCLP